ncbi:MAG: FAD-dependent oxidoreductase [Pseudomonadota bacterium]
MPTKARADVTVVGAGLAGLCATLRLVERGFSVDIYEHRDSYGGSYGGHHVPAEGTFHEHSYHMLPAWYDNFYQLASDINLAHGNEPIVQFSDRDTFVYISRDGTRTYLRNVGDVASFVENLLQSPVPPLHSFLSLYTLLALLAPDPLASQNRERISVNGFIYSRWWTTPEVSQLQNEVLAKAFASAVNRSSAETYRNFVAYGFRKPTPMTRVLKGDSHNYFIKPLIEAINSFNDRRGRPLARFFPNRTVTRLHLGNGRVDCIDVVETQKELDGQFQLEIDWASVEDWPGKRSVGVNELVMAISPESWVHLLDNEIIETEPQLARLGRLRWLSMMSLDLYLKDKLESMPKDFVILEGSEFELTFIDNSQAWPDVPHTLLNVVLSSANGTDLVDEFEGVPGERVIQRVLEELNHYLKPAYGIEIGNDDVDWERTWLNRNQLSPLFLNEVGTWQFRPDTMGRLPNLFLAGAFCRTQADVLTLEGAVISGLLAAEALRQKHDRGAPVLIHDLERYQPDTAGVLAAAWMPAAAMAKAWTAWSDPWKQLVERLYGDPK